jgi:hypothetical protein
VAEPALHLLSCLGVWRQQIDSKANRFPAASRRQDTDNPVLLVLVDSSYRGKPRPFGSPDLAKLVHKLDFFSGHAPTCRAPASRPSYIAFASPHGWKFTSGDTANTTRPRVMLTVAAASLRQCVPQRQNCSSIRTRDPTPGTRHETSSRCDGEDGSRCGYSTCDPAPDPAAHHAASSAYVR